MADSVFVVATYSQYNLLRVKCKGRRATIREVRREGARAGKRRG
jgi:hypothetical protein